jgi:hypothetical protein
MMIKIRYILLLTCFSAAVISCEKAPLRNTEYTIPTDKAFVRIALLSPGTPAVMIKADDVKLNGNTTSGNGGFFPSTVTFPDYASVAPGSTFKLSLPNTGTQNDSVVLFNSKLDVQTGKFYSLTLADTGTNRTAFAIEDQFAPQKDSFLNVRLINAMVGSTLNLIRVDSTNATDVVRDTLARNVPYKGTSGFISVKTFSSRSFIRVRITTSTGRNLGTAQTPPQLLTTGSRRSITYYSFGFVDATAALYTPGLLPHITNQ